MSVAHAAEPLVEPVIAMLKPDAWERGLAADILARLQADGFVEERRREVQLTPEEVKAMFLHPLPDYVDHLTSRPVSFHLLRGPGGPNRLYESKCAVRRAHGVPSKVRNLIHGTDEGTEYHLFLSHFFPDEPVSRHCGVADLDLRFASGTAVGHAREQLARLDTGSDLTWVCVALGPDQDRLLSLQGCRWTRLQVGFALTIAAGDGPAGCSLLIHARAGEDLADLMQAARQAERWEACAADSRPITLAELPLPDETLSVYARDLRAPVADIDSAVRGYPVYDTVEMLKRCGITRMNVFRPHASLMEVELLGDLARLAGLQASGGSAGQDAPGSFSVSQHCLGGLDWERA